MKTIHFTIILLSGILTLLISCQKNNEVTTSIYTDKIKINYDFDKLNLFLNSDVSQSKSRINWKWDHMNSRNGKPDTTDVEYFENREQAFFKFDGQKTLPSLSIVTYKNKIIKFSAVTLFSLAKHDQETIITLFDSLKPYNLLSQAEVRQAILENSRFLRSTESYEEELRLQLAEEEYGYSRISYEIKLK